LAKVVRQLDTQTISYFFQSLKGDEGVIEKKKVIELLASTGHVIQAEHIDFIWRDFNVRQEETMDERKFSQFFKMGCFV